MENRKREILRRICLTKGDDMKLFLDLLIGAALAGIAVIPLAVWGIRHINKEGTE